MKKIAVFLTILFSNPILAGGCLLPLAAGAVPTVIGVTLIIYGNSHPGLVDNCFASGMNTCCVSDANKTVELYNCKRWEKPDCGLEHSQSFCMNKDDHTLLASSSDDGFPDWNEASCQSNLQNCCVSVDSSTQELTIEQCQSSGNPNCTSGKVRSLCIDRSGVQTLIGNSKMNPSLWRKTNEYTRTWIMLGVGIVLIIAAVPSAFVSYLLLERLNHGPRHPSGPTSSDDTSSASDPVSLQSSPPSTPDISLTGSNSDIPLTQFSQ